VNDHLPPRDRAYIEKTQAAYEAWIEADLACRGDKTFDNLQALHETGTKLFVRVKVQTPVLGSRHYV
jgi:hypothetical protein